MLSQETLVSFLATTDAARARAFYEGALGLTLIGDHEHLMTFQSGAARIALQKGVQANPRAGTSLGWNVTDIRATLRDLVSRGVVFERYEGMEQDDLGVWSPMPGTGVAWFKDPDGNLLSLSQGA
jgi:catechol 2,3-dioxygenase-like lactoylglutathione lyase family enzyme